MLLAGTMTSKYIPPHLRGVAAAAPTAATASPVSAAHAEPTAHAAHAESQSHLDWLRAQQTRYTAVTKTPEQLKAEFAVMTFEQLRARAGPPPNVCADEFVWSSEGCAPDDTGNPDKTVFDSNMGAFKRGQGPPPGPLEHNQRDYEGSNARVNAYSKWYSAWGVKLWNKWYEEHPRHAPMPKTTKPKKTVVEETKTSWRVVTEEVSEKSGW